MQPFFKSAYGSIIPFDSVVAIPNVKHTKAEITVNTSNIPAFTFKDIQDRDAQLKNYEDYLINNYKNKELL